MNIILFGPPGAGKGTQAKNLEKKLNNFQVSTGDILRDEIKKESEIGRTIINYMNEGKFVDDKIVNNLIKKVVFDTQKKGKLIFDGYPRTLAQAENLDSLLKTYDQKIQIVLKLNVSLETVKKRILERKILEKRTDDNEEVAIKRFQTYERSSEPVLEHYKQSNLVKVINGEGTISEINTEISGLIDANKG